MTPHRWVFISPHLDDAALSCGGLISHLTGNGEFCLNVTLTSGIPHLTTTSPLIDEIQREWGMTDPADAVIARKVEDQNAMRTLGCAELHLEQLDAIYRQDAEGSFLYSSIFDPIHPFEADRSIAIATAIRQHTLPTDRLVFPLAIGGHVDHVLTHNASYHLTHEIAYYIDVPYCFNPINEVDMAFAGYEQVVFPFEEKNVLDWTSAIMCYPSQISSLFKDEADMTMKIKQYFSRNKGIILLRKGS